MIPSLSSSLMIPPFSFDRKEKGDVAPSEKGKNTGEEKAGKVEKGGAENGVLSPEEERIVAKLKETDSKVRQHEAMHMAAGGGLVTSGPNYEYETGPDGARYAVAGEVGIDASRASTPEETVQKAKRIRAAALAPADPSPQDRSVASMASQMEMQALQEIAQQRMGEVQGGSEKEGGESSKVPGKGKGAEDFRPIAAGNGAKTSEGAREEGAKVESTKPESAKALAAYRFMAGQESGAGVLSGISERLGAMSGGISAYA